MDRSHQYPPPPLQQQQQQPLSWFRAPLRAPHKSRTGTSHAQDEIARMCAEWVAEQSRHLQKPSLVVPRRAEALLPI